MAKTINNRQKKSKYILLFMILTLFGCNEKSESTALITQEKATEQLHTLLKNDWQSRLESEPEWASFIGNKSYNQAWSDLSLSAIESNNLSNKNALTQLAKIDYQALSTADKVNYDLFKQQYELTLSLYEFSPYLMPITQREGVQTIDTYADYFNLTTRQDYTDWLIRLEKLPTLIEQNIALMQEGIKRGVVPPKATMSRLPNQIKKQLVDDVKQSLFFTTFKNMPDSISTADKEHIQQQASVIAQQIIPAYQKLHTFFVKEYIPACRDTHGVWDLPNGKAYYQALVTFFTTTALTPDEIHNIGLKEVARNREEMDKVIAEVNFDGNFSQFLTFLRTDPQFYYQSPEELFQAYQAISKRLDPELVHLFGKMPRMPYGVKAIPDTVAPDTTTAYYLPSAADGSRAGYYYVNLYQPETRPKYEMEVLSVHEAVPGHHFQIALQQEMKDMPDFRRFGDFTVFVEGWGLYSERLGYEMGLYKDPYSRFGQLTYDMWRSIRLVVDTGIHYKGWTRQQAIDYFMANAAKSEADIINEIDRYIAMPGQALAYKIGQLKILALREKAETVLGDKFNIKSFHDAVLANGSIPLSVLETNIEQWIASQQRL